MLAGGTFEEWFSFNCNEAVKYLDAVEEGDKETLDVAQHWCGLQLALALNR